MQLSLLALGLATASAHFGTTIVHQLLGFDEVIPLGFSAENAITSFKNAGYKWDASESAQPSFGEKAEMTRFTHYTYHFNKPLAK